MASCECYHFLSDGFKGDSSASKRKERPKPPEVSNQRCPPPQAFNRKRRHNEVPCWQDDCDV